MSNEEYIELHPEQFKDEIDKWLFKEFGIIGGCCSAEKSHEYAIARMVAEKQLELFEKNRLAACDRQTEEEAEIESDFVIGIIEKEHRQPTFDDAIKYGMKLKAEQFIKEHTRSCSNEIEWNEIEWNDTSFTGLDYVPWLTPDQARRAVEIAREELIDKACKWWKEELEYPSMTTEEVRWHRNKIRAFRKAMEKE